MSGAEVTFLRTAKIKKINILKQFIETEQPLFSLKPVPLLESTYCFSSIFKIKYDEPDLLYLDWFELQHSCFCQLVCSINLCILCFLISVCRLTYVMSSIFLYKSVFCQTYVGSVKTDITNTDAFIFKYFASYTEQNVF